MTSDIDNQRLAVLLGYYNGNLYLKEQLLSVLNQSHSNLNVFISDDGSIDQIDVDGLGLTAEQLEKVHVSLHTQNSGFTRNFLNLLHLVDDGFSFFAFCDQDDIWHDDKLERAVKTLAEYPESKPLLYCSRTEITDQSGQQITGLSPLFSRKKTFSNALVQNVGGGNTMVFNRTARELIINSSLDIEVVSHDWWCYQVVTGAGGVTYYDREPTLRYRQHSKNVVGKNNHLKARLARARGLLSGKFRKWNDINVHALWKNRHLLTIENRRILFFFKKARNSGLIRRVYYFLRSGVFRQTMLGNLALFIGILIKRI